MGSCSSVWLLLMALLPPIKRSLVYCQRTDDHRLTFLVAIKGNGSGLEVRTLLPENHSSEPQMKFIPGYSLSSKCGDEYYQCQELLVINDSQQFSVQNNMDHNLESLNMVFVPLKTGVLLLRFWYDSNAMTMQWNISIVNSSNCTPTAFYTINGTFYMVCITAYYGEHFNVAVYELQLNFSGSDITLAEQTAINIDSSLNFSNFIVVDQRIYLLLEALLLCWIPWTQHGPNNIPNYLNALKFINLHLLGLEINRYYYKPIAQTDTFSSIQHMEIGTTYTPSQATGYHIRVLTTAIGLLFS